MRRRNWITVTIALAAAASCFAAVIHFLFTIFHNELPLSAEQPLRDHYLAVGQSYTQGFVVGFFLCFSLATAAVALSNLLKKEAARPRLSRSSIKEERG